MSSAAGDRAASGVSLVQQSAKYVGIENGYYRVNVVVKNTGSTASGTFNYNFTIDKSWTLWNNGAYFVQTKKINPGASVTFYTYTTYKPSFVEMNGYPYYVSCTEAAHTVR